MMEIHFTYPRLRVATYDFLMCCSCNYYHLYQSNMKAFQATKILKISALKAKKKSKQYLKKFKKERLSIIFIFILENSPTMSRIVRVHEQPMSYQFRFRLHIKHISFVMTCFATDIIRLPQNFIRIFI